jgi:hypothetical protein
MFRIILLNKIISSLALLVISAKSYSQEDIPTYVLASKYFSKQNAIGVIIRFDNGIDSINFPIDTTKIKIHLKTLDIEGKSLSNNKVYYEYQFTPKINGRYKLPEGIIWSKSKSYEMTFKDSINLSIPDSIVKNDHVNEENERLLLFNRYEKEREESKIFSRLETNPKKRAIMWSDNKDYKINDQIRIIIEVQTDFDSEDLKANLLNNIDKKLKLLRNYNVRKHENGKKQHYSVFIFKALEIGTIEIPSFKIKIKKRTIETNSWLLVIKN